MPFIRKTTKMSRFTENPDEIVLEDVKIFHLESMNERTLWIGVYTQDGKTYHLNISANGDKLNYWWSDETCDSKWDDPIPPGVDPYNLRGRS
jgi:hypothetical protein